MTTTRSQSSAQEGFGLSAQQVSYFNTFGFLHLRGLFRDDIEKITAAFERVFVDPQHKHWEMYGSLHGEERRVILASFIDKDEELQKLRDDPRVLGVVRSLVGDVYDYAESDGNIWYCETFWHSDVYGSPLSTFHVKLSFYLDPLADSGAIRLIPGSNFYAESYAQALHRDLSNHEKIPDIYGVEGNQVPAWTLESEPGDLIVWNQRTMHASYNGGDRRRSFAITFKEREQVADHYEDRDGTRGNGASHEGG